jgi:hypothetical protein
MKQRAWIGLALLIVGGASQLHAQALPGATPAMQAALQHGEWPVYAGSNGSYLVGGKQYIVFPVGGGANVPEELVAVGLP